MSRTAGDTTRNQESKARSSTRNRGLKDWRIGAVQPNSNSNSDSNPESTTQNPRNDATLPPRPHVHSQGAPDTVSAAISSGVSCSVTGPGATCATTSAGGTARTFCVAPGRAEAAREGEVEKGRRSVAGECEGRRERRVKRDMVASGAMEEGGRRGEEEVVRSGVVVRGCEWSVGRRKQIYEGGDWRGASVAQCSGQRGRTRSSSPRSLLTRRCMLLT
jgi:hypothetical protein